MKSCIYLRTMRGSRLHTIHYQEDLKAQGNRKGRILLPDKTIPIQLSHRFHWKICGPQFTQHEQFFFLHLDIKIITMELLLYFVDSLPNLCTNSLASLFYSYVFEAKLFRRYVNENVLNDLMLSVLDIIIEHDTSIPFIISYAMSLDNSPALARFVLTSLQHIDKCIERPAVCQLFEYLYSRCTPSLLLAVNYTLLPIITNLVDSNYSCRLLHLFIQKSDDMTLLSLIDYISAAIRIYISESRQSKLNLLDT